MEVGNTMSKIKPRRLKVISVCSKCGEPVAVTKGEKAYRHGFSRFKRKLSEKSLKAFLQQQYSQEDGTACEGSGKPVVYCRA